MYPEHDRIVAPQQHAMADLGARATEPRRDVGDDGIDVAARPTDGYRVHAPVDCTRSWYDAAVRSCRSSLCIAGALALGCGEGAAATSSTTSDDSTGAPSDTTSSSSAPGTTQATSEDGDSSSTESVCAGPFSFGPATSWTRYGYDASNSRHNAAERAITPETIACLEPLWTIDALPGVTSTPANEGGTVYFGDWAGQLHARDVATGDEQWIAPLGLQLNDSPLVGEATVWIGDNDGFVHAVARDDGSVRWSIELDDHPMAAIYGSPIAAGSRLLVGVASTELTMLMDDYTFRGSIVALDPDTGDEQWRTYVTTDDETAGAGVSVWSTAAIDLDRNLAFIGTGNTYEPPAAPLSDSLLALDLSTGDIAWSRQFTAGDVYTIFMPEPQGVDADIGAAPNLFAIDDRDVVGVGDKAGVYAVLDRDDGETIWATQLGPGSHLGGVMTTAAVGDGVVYVASNIWVGSIFDFGSDENSAVVYALDAATGTTLWQRPMPRPVFGALTLAGGVVWHTTIDGTLHGLEAATGVELWNARPGGDDPDAGMGGGVAIVDGTVYVGYGFWFFTEPGTLDRGGLVAYALPS
jgi:polyvinyl alcohol dehydrogenase (cytochrome)